MYRYYTYTCIVTSQTIMSVIGSKSTLFLASRSQDLTYVPSQTSKHSTVHIGRVSPRLALIITSVFVETILEQCRLLFLVCISCTLMVIMEHKQQMDGWSVCVCVCVCVCARARAHTRWLSWLESFLWSVDIRELACSSHSDGELGHIFLRQETDTQLPLSTQEYK